eukprot:g67525.t1
MANFIDKLYSNSCLKRWLTFKLSGTDPTVAPRRRLVVSLQCWGECRVLGELEGVTQSQSYVSQAFSFTDSRSSTACVKIVRSSKCLFIWIICESDSNCLTFLRRLSHHKPESVTYHLANAFLSD